MKNFIKFIIFVLLVSPLSAFGAIAFDVGTVGGYFATMNNATFSFTATTTANRILFCATFGKAPTPTDSVTNVSYAGVQLTKVTSTPTQGPDGRWETLWYLIAPATGANTVSSTATGGDGAMDCASYTGVAQTDPINDSVTNSNSVAGTAIAIQATSTVDSSWMIAVDRLEGGNNTAGGGSTLRVDDANGQGIYDNNAAISPAGSNEMGVGSSASTYYAVVAATFSPFVESTSTVSATTMQIIWID